MASNPLPSGPFDVILADPAWRFQTRSDKGRGRCPDAPVSRDESRRNQAERHYATMTLDEIKALPVASVAAKDAVLFMWAVDPMIPQALDVGAAWGFTFKTVGFYWAKLRKAPMKPGRDEHLDDERKAFPMGTGYWTRANPEICLLFTRGRPKRADGGIPKLIALDIPGCPMCEQGVPLHEMTELPCEACVPEQILSGEPKLIVSRRREHSRKPDEQYDRIERLMTHVDFGGPADLGKPRYLEMFARQQRPGWISWGNETEKFIDKTFSDPRRLSRSRSTAELIG